MKLYPSYEALPANPVYLGSDDMPGYLSEGTADMIDEYRELQAQNDEYRQLVKQCADQGRALAQIMVNNGSIEPLYLYCCPSEPGKGPGRLMLARDSAPNAEGLSLVTGEGLRSNVEFSRYDDWIFSRAKRAPILSTQV